MTYENRFERPEQMQPEAFDSRALDNRLQQAADARPETIWGYDQELGGEIRTSVLRDGGIDSVAQAEVHCRDSTVRLVGEARYKVSGNSATIYFDRFPPQTCGVENALYDKVSEQARARGATRLQGWAPDGDQDAVKRWQSLGFHPTQCAPGAAGVFYERPI